MLEGEFNIDNLKPIFDNLFAQKIPTDVLEKSHHKLFEKMASDKSLDVVLPAKEQLRNLFGKSGEPFSTSIGVHPDFEDLGDNEYRNQYICSLFLDISGSTKLGVKFPLSTVRMYKNAILNSAIEIFQVFDAHIHRLQGDAVFAFFGHKNMKKSDAIINALNAASLMQSYNKYTLKDFFIQNDLEPLRIRIGIDIGDDHQVLWSKYGLNQTTEVTSTSIHTDLAAKLQGKTPRNSIMLGENVYTYMDLPGEFISVKTVTSNGEKKDDKYILNDSHLKAYYQMRVFDWEKYLSEFSFLPKEQSTKYRSPDNFEIKCEVSEDLQNIVELKSNTQSVKKEASIAFKLELKGLLKQLKPSSIEWKVINRGKEANESESELSFYMNEYKDKYICEQSTAYNGHHYMQCSIYDSQGNLVGRDRFGVYVNDDKHEMLELGVAEDAKFLPK